MKKKLIYFWIIIVSVANPTSVNTYPSTTAEIEPVHAIFQNHYQIGTKFTWTILKFNNSYEWLRSDTIYHPKAGDKWNMTIIGDLTKLSLRIVDLFFFGIAFDQEEIPAISDYLSFNISGYTLEETFVYTEENGKFWRALSRIFLLPTEILFSNGSTSSFINYYVGFMENEINFSENIQQGNDFLLDGSLSGGEYQGGSFEINCSLGLREKFSYKRNSPVSGTLLSEFEYILEGIIEPDDSEGEEENGKNAPTIPGFNLFIIFSTVGISIINITQKDNNLKKIKV